MAGDDEVGGNLVAEDELGAEAGVDAGGEGWYQKLINGVSLANTLRETKDSLNSPTIKSLSASNFSNVVILVIWPYTSYR